MALPFSVKVTLPAGLLPATVAVKVTKVPAAAGVPEVASVVVVGAGAAAEVSRTSSTKAVKSLPLPTPVRVTVWLPLLATLNGDVW